MDSSPYVPLEQWYTRTTVQLDKEAQELNKSIELEREIFEKNKQNQQDKLDEVSLARQNLIQRNQNGIKTAVERRHQEELNVLLSRHQQELAIHQSETDKNIQELKDDAEKAKEQLERRSKERKEEMEKKFLLWKKQLEKRTKEEETKLADGALRILREQCNQKTKVDTTHLQWSRPPVVATPSPPLANIVLEPLTPNPITPRAVSPADPATRTPQVPTRVMTSSFQREAAMSTPPRQSVASASNTPAGGTIQLVAGNSQVQQVTVPSKVGQITPPIPRVTTPSKLRATPKEPLQGTSLNFAALLPPKTPMKIPFLVRYPLSANLQGDISNKNRAPSNSRQDGLQLAQRTPTPAQGEKRKIFSGGNGYSQKSRVNTNDDSDDDEVVEVRSRPAKHPRTTSPWSGDKHPMISKFIRSSQKEKEKALSQNPPGQHSAISQPSAGQRERITRGPPKAIILSKTASPYGLSSLPENQRARLPLQDTFEVDRVRYRRDERSYYFWHPNRAKPIAHHLCLENDMYRPYVGFRIADPSYSPWVISPKRVNKLEFCTEERLVKITRGPPGEPLAEIWIGFADPFIFADFMRSFKWGWSTKEAARMDSSVRKSPISFGTYSELLSRVTLTSSSAEVPILLLKK